MKIQLTRCGETYIADAIGEGLAHLVLKTERDDDDGTRIITVFIGSTELYYCESNSSDYLKQLQKAAEAGFNRLIKKLAGRCAAMEEGVADEAKA